MTDQVLHLVTTGGPSVSGTPSVHDAGRPADTQAPDPERWRQVVAVILDRWPTPAARTELAREVAAEAQALLAGQLTPDALRRAGALVSLALDVLEAPVPTEEGSQP